MPRKRTRTTFSEDSYFYGIFRTFLNITLKAVGEFLENLMGCCLGHTMKNKSERFDTISVSAISLGFSQLIFKGDLN